MTAAERRMPQATIVQDTGGSGAGSVAPVSALTHEDSFLYIAGLRIEVPKTKDMDPELLIGSLQSRRIMIDSGSGANVFPKNFDESSIEVGGPSTKLATIAGETLPLSSKRRSHFGTREGPQLRVDYHESDQVLYPVLSVSEAARKSLYMISKDNAELLKNALNESKKLELVKDKGVYWLPIDEGYAGSDEHLIGAARPAKKTYAPKEGARPGAERSAPPPLETAQEGNPSSGSRDRPDLQLPPRPRRFLLQFLKKNTTLIC